MRRGSFLSALAAGAWTLCAARPRLFADEPASPSPLVELPAVFWGGRPFLRPTAPDGTRVLVWLDTDGSGFIREELVRRLGLAVSGKRAAVPRWREQIPGPGGDGLLPILPAGENDPILAGVDVQFGGMWFAKRVWTIDYRNQQVAWQSDGANLTASAIETTPIQFSDERKLYPLAPIVIEGEKIPMSLDTAASIVQKSGKVAATSFITRARFDAWRTAHPEWNARSISRGVDAIDVPDVRMGNIGLGGVTFTTRPNDDVFEGEAVTGKLGSNAWQARLLILDYTRAFAGFG